MAKVLRCGDLVPGCNAVIEGKDEAEVMAKGAEHAKAAHKMTAIPPEMAAKVTCSDPAPDTHHTKRREARMKLELGDS